jgi:hypothetical protein
MANHPNRNAAGKMVIVDDGQYRWVADKSALIAALDDLGWTKGMHLGRRSRTEPESEDGEAYSALCNRVPALEIEPADEMDEFGWAPAEGAWLWEIR